MPPVDVKPYGRITRVQWSKGLNPRITIYDEDGVFAILTGKQAAAFNWIIGDALGAAEEARKENDNAVQK